MRLIKMLGLAAMAAMVAMAFVGASSASANSETVVLCKAAELTCEEQFPNPTTIVAHAVEPKLLSSIGTILCATSLAEVTLLNTLSTLINGHLLELSFQECHLGATSCNVTVNKKGGLSFTKSEALLAKVNSILLEEKETTATVKCGIFINCTYGGEPTLTAHSTAGGTTTLVANEAVLSKSSGICPETSKWDATYTALGTMWIES